MKLVWYFVHTRANKTSPLLVLFSLSTFQFLSDHLNVLKYILSSPRHPFGPPWLSTLR